jgi:hypothetical protein
MLDTTETHQSDPAARPATLINRREWLIRGVFESGLIVFCVLLALTLDNWRDARDRARRLSEARGALVQELDLNRRLLAEDRHLPHHERLHEIYEAMEVSGRFDRFDAMFKQGVHPPLLRQAAWRSFSQSDVAADLPFRHRAMLENIYAGQASLEAIYRILIGGVSMPTGERETPAFIRDFVRVIDLSLTDIVFAERQLIREYEEALRELQRE